MTRIDEIKKRLAAATPGPWLKHEAYHVICKVGEALHGIVCRLPPKDTDADLIANAPADLAYLIERLEAAEALLDAVNSGNVADIDAYFNGADQ